MQPRIIRMVWDVDAKNTNAMMNDVGVSVLATDEQTADRNSNATSSFTTSQSIRSHVSKSMVSNVLHSINISLASGILILVN